ncbi:aspartate kinase [Lentilactobacillus curieae]|uniref:Aspartokinase n=1 Tax=Lentilactobacillus curieae TaxID=1138822 RepID=A0A1S6QHV4_9LACO|nr:aspartate kinase [Lentilactobacillus curieae]AQW21196.1 aspartate kinase [Lentilactobacillus curieae]
MKVAKFGGSSVADAGQFKKVAKIVKSDPTRRIVVVSAAGKWQAQKIKVTDLLIDSFNANAKQEDFHQPFAIVRHRLVKIQSELGLTTKIEADLDEIEAKIPSATYDYVVSRGEYLTAKLMANYIGYSFIDAAKFITFRDGDVDLGASKRKLENEMLGSRFALVPGFYGADEAGNIKLMPRGGSDITGAIIANLVDADLYENWTDVSGVKVADPRIIDHSKKIDELTYSELQELSYMGISVFQEEAVEPVREKHIPIAILNTNAPSEGGTIVASSVISDKQQLVTGIAGKKNYVVISIKKHQLSRRMDILQSAIEVLSKFNVMPNFLPSGNDAVSFLIDFNQVEIDLDKIVSELKSKIDVDSVDLRKNIALVAAVSAKFSKHPAIAGKILEKLDKSDIDVHMVVQEGSDIKLVVGVDNDDYERTIRELYLNSSEVATSRISAVIA